MLYYGCRIICHCGIDHITVYDNHTNPELCLFDICSLFNNVTYVKYDCIPNQLQLYNEHYKKSNAYDYLICIDDDEMIYLDKTKYRNIKDYLLEYSNYDQVCVFWQFMSSKSDTILHVRNDPYVQCCTYTLGQYNKFKQPLCKSFVKTNLNNASFLTAHRMYGDLSNITSLGSSFGKYGESLFHTNVFTNFEEYMSAPCKIFHYLHKSLQELIHKYTNYDVSTSNKFSTETLNRELNEFISMHEEYTLLDNSINHY